MALQFILGGSGSGKSLRLYRQLAEQAERNPDGRFVLLVPEQFTMQTQRDLVTLTERHGISNIDVLSFQRLAYRVFDEIGMPEQMVLEDTGKNMVLRRLLSQKEKELVYFRNTSRKQGFVEELKSFLTELYQYSVTPKKLRETVEKSAGKPLLHQKLADTLVLYEAFQEFKGSRGLTVAEEILDTLCEVLPRSERIKGSVICLDGFTGFTPSQYKLLRLLLPLAKDVVVTVTIDEREPLHTGLEEFRLFHLSKKTIGKLEKLAKEAGVPAAKPIFTSWKAENPQLRHLEQHLFRYPVRPYRAGTKKKRDTGISIRMCRDPRAEAEFVLTETLRLVREEGYRYRDIAVIVGDMAGYAELLDETLERGHIFRFIDQKRDITRNPLVELIRASLSVLEEDFSYESVMRYLRSGFSSLPDGEADLFENELLARGIRGRKRYEEAWYEGLSEEKPSEEKRSVEGTQAFAVFWDCSEEEAGRRLAVDGVRAHICARFREISAAFREAGRNGATMTAALYEFLLAHRAEERLEAFRDEFARDGRVLLEKEYGQVYRLIMGLLDKMAELLGDETLTTEEYRRILESGFSEEQVGLIPPGLDQVVVGDLERTRLKDVKALFCLGLNEGIVPKGGSTGGIITDLDRDRLLDLDLELAPTQKARNYTEQFYLYLNLTKPKEHLYLSYSGMGMDGKSLRPSYLIGKLTQLFPELAIRTEEKKTGDLVTELRRDGGMDYLLRGLTEGEDGSQGWQEVFSYYRSLSPAAEEFAKLMEGYRSKAVQNRLQTAVAGKLYGEVAGSVTRLEEFASCAFAHFLTYGLGLRERQEYRIRIPDIGSIFHDAIERFSKKVGQEGFRWKEIPEEDRARLVGEAVEEATSEYGNRILHSTKRMEALIDRVRRITDRTVWAVCEQLKCGEFEPKEFETRFSFEAMQGRIDRMDTAGGRITLPDGTAVDAEYVRIIDYKSGAAEFDLNRFYYGLGMQLVVYLKSALEKEKEENPQQLVIPAGIFYYHIKDPIVEKGAGEDAVLRELALSGLVNEDIRVEALMDRSLVDDEGKPVPSAKSGVIPVSLNKEGKHTVRSSVASVRQMELLVGHVEGEIRSARNAILSGEIAAKPYRLGKRTSCDYCEYRSICSFDSRLPGYEYRRLIPKETPEIWAELEKGIRKASGEGGFSGFEAFAEGGEGSTVTGEGEAAAGDKKSNTAVSGKEGGTDGGK